MTNFRLESKHKMLAALVGGSLVAFALTLFILSNWPLTDMPLMQKMTTYNKNYYDLCMQRIDKGDGIACTCFAEKASVAFKDKIGKSGSVDDINNAFWHDLADRDTLYIAAEVPCMPYFEQHWCLQDKNHSLAQCSCLKREAAKYVDELADAAKGAGYIYRTFTDRWTPFDYKVNAIRRPAHEACGLVEPKDDVDE